MKERWRRARPEDEGGHTLIELLKCEIHTAYTKGRQGRGEGAYCEAWPQSTNCGTEKGAGEQGAGWGPRSPGGREQRINSSTRFPEPRNIWLILLGISMRYRPSCVTRPTHQRVSMAAPPVILRAPSVPLQIS